MKKVTSLLLSLLLIWINSPSVAASDAFYTDLKLITPIPQTIASSTIILDIQPSSYPQDFNLQPSNFPSTYEYKDTIVSVCDTDQFCGNNGLTDSPGVRKIRVNGDYRGASIYVLGVNTNRIVFSFEKTGKYLVNVTKAYSREAKPLDRSFWGNVTTQWLYEKITIPVEITDVSKGGIDIRDLSAAGIELSLVPRLKCPEKIKNIKQTISCDLSYAYEQKEYFILVDPYESFKVCAYKVDEDSGRCSEKPSPYFSKDFKISLNSVATVKIPISKDVDTAIYLQWEKKSVPDYKNKADFQYYFYKPIKYAPAKKENSSKGKWVKKCKTITMTEVLRPGELTDSVLNGGSGPSTYKKTVCADVWVPS